MIKENKGLKSIIIRLWNSPTLMTWSSFFIKSLNFVIVLPLLLTKLTVEEIALWYLLKIVINLQQIYDFGFGQTFSRMIAYGMGGISDLNKIGDENNISNSSLSPNWNTVEKVYATMGIVYKWMALGITLLLAIFGTMALNRPISLVNDPKIAWTAWILVIVTLAVSIYGTKYSTYLQGLNKIALYRRWETFVSVGSLISMAIALLLNSNILILVLVTQAWKILNVFINIILCRRVENGILKQFDKNKLEKQVFNAVWPSAWRSGIGQFMSYGLTQISGLIYAQIGSSASIASYLLGLQFVNTIVGFSKAPFYSKIPGLARLYSEQKYKEEVRLAQRGMIYSHWTFIVSFVMVGIFVPEILNLIKSHAEFVNPLMWILLGFGFFAERYGAMHLQLYSTTNHILWHIANGVSGIVYLIISFVLLPIIGVYAFPIGYIAGYLGYYAWYSALYSYKKFKMNFFEFESKTVLIPFIIFLIYSFSHLFTFYWK